ncbi:ciliary microtubule inner protein 2A [Melopsittacus undulatus]|uniref:ciliary microtubule inner protein 2A n=1 Tax=Melopsittacus undulatus TaxID=13146 RepID=UPI00146D71CA|nr:protein FAM166A [Melopsittacus undulatus]
MAASKEKSIFPSHPYHIPGYKGFIPQYSFQYGETFGRTTHRLLTDPTIARSPRTLLAPLQKLGFSEEKHGAQGHLPGHPGCFPYETAGATATFPDPLKPELTEEELTMMHMDPKPWHHPGAYIPRTQVVREYPPSVPHYPVFEGQEWLTRRCGSGQLGGAWAGIAPGQVTLPPLTQEPVSTNGAEEEEVWLPETDLPNVILQKVITGYAGFIPRLTWCHGVNYIRSVKEAMKEFDQHQFKLRNPCYSFGKRYPQNYWPTNRIYTSAGLIPFYMGFVPELRDTYALTYGNSTRKAYQKEQERQARAL